MLADKITGLGSDDDIYGIDDITKITCKDEHCAPSACTP